MKTSIIIFSLLFASPSFASGCFTIIYTGEYLEAVRKELAKNYDQKSVDQCAEIQAYELSCSSGEEFKDKSPKCVKARMPAEAIVKSQNIPEWHDRKQEELNDRLRAAEERAAYEKDHPSSGGAAW